MSDNSNKDDFLTADNVCECILRDFTLYQDDKKHFIESLCYYLDFSFDHLNLENFLRVIKFYRNTLIDLYLEIAKTS